MLNPIYQLMVHDKGFPVKSTRTARLQSSEDENTLFNIAHSGNNGQFARYKVNGAGSFT